MLIEGVWYDPVTLIFMRLGCALLAGLALGLEREYNGHAAGLRTTLLVCLAPALAAVMMSKADVNAQARVIQGLLAGVGFIGGGVILKQGDTDTVRGVTTAAVLWMATVLGVLFGFGLFTLGFIGLGASMFIVYLLSYVTPRFQNMRHHATLSITVESGTLTARKAVEILSWLNIQATVKSFDFNLSSGNDTLRFFLKYRHGDTLKIPALVREEFSTRPGVRQIHWN